MTCRHDGCKYPVHSKQSKGAAQGFYLFIFDYMHAKSVTPFLSSCVVYACKSVTHRYMCASEQTALVPCVQEVCTIVAFTMVARTLCFFKNKVQSDVTSCICTQNGDAQVQCVCRSELHANKHAYMHMLRGYTHAHMHIHVHMHTYYACVEVSCTPKSLTS